MSDRDAALRATAEYRRLAASRDRDADRKNWGPYQSERARDSSTRRRRAPRPPGWRDHLLFHESFHGDSGRGLDASHQTGWTALVATLLQERGGL